MNQDNEGGKNQLVKFLVREHFLSFLLALSRFYYKDFPKDDKNTQKLCNIG